MRDLKTTFRKQLVSLLALAGLIFSFGLTSSPAFAANDVEDKNAAAIAVYEAVLEAADQDAAVDALSPQERELFIYAVTPVEEVLVDIPTNDNIDALAATCGSMTQYGQGKSAVGLALYDFWTSGRICWNGPVSSATYLGGGGSSGAIGWSYTGTSSNQGIVGGWGYAAGTHYFQLKVGGIVIQSPVGCARVVGSPGGALFGDVGTCGIG